MPQSYRLYTGGQGNAATQDRRVALNTQGANNASLPAKQTITTTSETVINDPVLAGASALVCQIPPGGPCEQEVFELVGSGIVTIGTGSTLTIAVRQGTTISGTKIATSGASGSLSAGTYNWNFRLRLMYDSTSLTLTGTMQFIINGVVVQAEAALTGNGTLVAGLFGSPAGNTANPVVQFLITAQFGTAGTQVFTVKDFGVNH